MTKILLNKNGRNHIKIMPLGNIEYPEDPAERVIWCQKAFEELRDSDAERLYYYCNRKTGLLTGVYDLGGIIYLTNCIRDLDGNYITTIYIGMRPDDAVNVAKFLVSNNKEITDDYRNQIIEGVDEWLKLQKPDSQTK